ncbi:MAG: DUF401 family protein [Lachnospiraceae bacterium]|nr:DUF401 family protein [Lachnospiraceae bacterium]
MEMIKLVIIFAVMIGICAMKKPLWLAALIASVCCFLLYQVPVLDGLTAIWQSISAKSTIQLLILTYVICFLQSMIKKKEGVDRAQKALTRVFHNNWITCTVAPFVVGLLPTAPAVFFSGDIIEEAVGDRLTPAQKATAASFFRHISEAFLPTYSAILTALALTGIAAGPFVLGMLPMMIVMELIGCFFLYRGRVPAKAEGEASQNKGRDLLTFFISLWPLIVAIILVVGFGLNVLLAIAIVTIAYFFLDRFAFVQIKPFFKSSFQLKVFLNTLSVYTFKGALGATGILTKLPEFFENIPIPAFLIFTLLCFIGTVIAGSLTITTTMVPVAFASIPGAGLPLLCLLMCFIYAAMQISPTHVCLSLSCDHFGTSLGELIKTTLPIILTFMVIVVLYYMGWTALIG